MSELILANGISLLETEVFLALFELFVLTFCYGTVNKPPFYEMEVSKLTALRPQSSENIYHKRGGLSKVCHFKTYLSLLGKAMHAQNHRMDVCTSL